MVVGFLLHKYRFLHSSGLVETRWSQVNSSFVCYLSAIPLVIEFSRKEHVNSGSPSNVTMYVYKNIERLLLPQSERDKHC